MDAVSQSLAGLPAFVIYFGAGLALLAVFLAIYSAVTPYNEFVLIREGNLAAAISLAGATLGFVLPLASAIAHSVSVIDMALWGVVALVAQIVVYFLVARLVPRLAEAIAAGRVAAAAFLATLAIAVGLLNAAAMTY
jgi:putative membrane protein